MEKLKPLKRSVLLLVLLFSLIPISDQAQLIKSIKRPLDIGVINKWEFLGRSNISPDGQFTSFQVDTNEITAINTGESIHICANHGNWHLVFPHSGDNPVFTANSRFAVLKVTDDSLFVVRLGQGIVEKIPHVSGFQIKGNRLYYSDNNRTLFCRDLASGRQEAYSSVADYRLLQDEVILIRQNSVDSSASLSLVKPGNLVEKRLWSGRSLSNVVVSADNRHLIFLGNDGALFYYQTGAGRIDEAGGNLISDLGASFEMAGLDSYDPVHQLLLYDVRKIEMRTKPKDTMDMVNIWSYNDQMINPGQPTDGPPKKDFKCVFDLATHHATLLEGENDDFFGESGYWFIIRHRNDVFAPDGSWHNYGQTFRLFNLKTGTAVVLGRFFMGFSFAGKYLVGYNPVLKNYFSYEVSTGKITNMTQNIHTTWTKYRYDNPDVAKTAGEIGGWTEDDKFVLLHDQFDLWLVDPQGLTPPVNLTNGEGLRRHIAFRTAENYGSGKVLPQKLLLTAFNCETKENGFYLKRNRDATRPELLTMGPYAYELKNDYGQVGETPQRAEKAEAWIVQRMSESNSANLYYTHDFRTFKAISNIHPETGFNWLTTELVNWQVPGYGQCQGILYKPEDFDSSKKYPVIFYYYEQLSDHLHNFLSPQGAFGPINIPWMVSHGYLVFEHDMHFDPGHVAEDATTTVVSAANYLSGLPFVDSLHMGINGHSFGGYETNNIVAHTNRFAAACSGSGMADVPSHDLGLWGGNAAMWYWEDGQGRIGHSLWELPDFYIKNSPVFYAQKVNTPILLMANPHDGGGMFLQTTEFFNALRRLGKKVWMLEYDNGGHTLGNPIDIKDYTIRTQQFFDHYLKGAPAPKWMVEGIPHWMKGIDDGLELEPSGVEPGPNLLTPEEQKKVDSLMTRKPVTITIQ